MTSYRFRIMPKGQPYYETEGTGINWGVAKTNVARREGVGDNQVVYLGDVKVEKSSSSSGGSGTSFEGSAGMIGLIAVACLLYAFTPWILMLVGGAAGAWISEKVTGQSIEEYNERDDDQGHRSAAIVLATALILGGVGFVQGDSLKKGFDAPSDVPTEVRPNN